MRKSKLLQVRLNSEEEKYLEELAERTCLSKSALVRLLILGYKPKEKPDDDFYSLLREMYAIGNNLNQLVAKAHSLGFAEKEKIDNVLRKHNKLIVDIEEKYLKPERSEDYGCNENMASV